MEENGPLHSGLQSEVWSQPTNEISRFVCNRRRGQIKRLISHVPDSQHILVFTYSQRFHDKYTLKYVMGTKPHTTRLATGKLYFCGQTHRDHEIQRAIFKF